MVAAFDASEVRRCRHCSQPSVVLVSDWKETMWGASTGSSTRDYRCQECGARFTIHPRSKQIALIVVGVVLLPAVVGAAFLALAWHRSRASVLNPIVPGAPRPQMRYRSGPPLRMCAGCA